MEKYKHEPLDLDRPAVRFVRLFRGRPGDSIRCEIFQGWIDQIDSGMPYNALSYAWGGTEKAAKIEVNGCLMDVTINLFGALQHIRLPYEDRILWVDAICIDQENTKERNHQVQQMSDIYKDAECVIVWLGEGNEESDLMMDAMQRLREFVIEVQGDWRDLARLWMQLNAVELVGGEGIKYEEEALRSGMNFMLEKPWFRRIWILQEIANAQIATIICGQKSISARIFAQAPSLIGLQPPSYCQAILDIMPGFSRKESWWKQDRGLQTLLIKFQKSEATDKRDIVYALLGISSDACTSDVLLPDYTKSLSELILDTMSYLLFSTFKHRHLLDFINWSLQDFLANLESLSVRILGLASEIGQAELVRLLLATNDIDADATSGISKTPLQRATENGHDAVMRLLLAKGAKLNWEYDGGNTPLHFACKYGNTGTVKALLDSGLDPNGKDGQGRTPLSNACENGNASLVNVLLNGGADINARDDNDDSPLFSALREIVDTGYRQRTFRWIEDLKIGDPKNNLTHIRAEGEAIITILLNAGANPNSIDRTGQTALMVACRAGYTAVLTILLEAGADPNLDHNTHDIRGDSPLFIAVFRHDQAGVRLLLDRGASLDWENESGQTPLSFAEIWNGEIAEMLRAAKFEREEAAKRGQMRKAVDSIANEILILQAGGA